MIAHISSPYAVGTFTNSGYTYFLIKREFEGYKIDTDIHAGSNWVDDLYIGKTKIKQVYIGADLYYDSSPTTYYVSGSKYRFTYCTFARNGTKYYSTTSYGVNILTGGGTLSVGFILVPELLYKIYDDGTVSLGSPSDLSLDLYYMGTKLYRASVSKGYMYYLNDYLVAIYNKTPNECSISTYFGAEVPMSLRGYYLDPWHLTFVCPLHIELCVSQNTNTSIGDSGPGTINTNDINITLSSTLDPVLLKDTMQPAPVLNI